MKTAPSLRLVFRNKYILIDQSYNTHPKHMATFLNETKALQAWLKKLSSPRQDGMIKLLHHILHLGTEGNREEFWRTKKYLHFA